MSSVAVQTNTAETLTPHEQWLGARKQFIGGSEAFELLNERQYDKGCARALGYEKLDIPPDYPEQLDDEPLLKRGKILEPLVAAMYEEETGRKLRRPSENNGYPKPVINKQFPWAGVHTDRLVLAGTAGIEETGDAEIKTRGEGPYWRVIRSGPFAGDLLQVQWSNFVTGHRWGALLILGVFGGLPLKHFDMTRNEQVIEVFKRAGDQFAEKVFVKRELPDAPFKSDDQRCKVCAWRMECRGEELDRAEAAALKAMKNGKEPLVQIANPELSQTLADIDSLKAEKKAIDSTLEVAQQKAKELLGAARSVYVEGYGKAYQIPCQANYLDGQKLKAEKPEVYDEFFVHRLTGDTYIRTYPAK